MSPSPDIVYPVRKGDWNEELRFSLRSLSNVPHNRVWIVGHCPPWVQKAFGRNPGVLHIPREQKSTKYRNATEALVEVAQELGSSMSAPFLLCNDDFYIMQPMPEIPVRHMGLAREVIDRYRRNRHTGAYWRGMVDTYMLLKNMGLPNALSYELHIPMPIYRDPLLEAWERGKRLPILHIRTMYGNIARLGGEAMDDVKLYRTGEKGKDDWQQWPFLSSNDDLKSNGLLPFLQERFPEPSPYEG